MDQFQYLEFSSVDGPELLLVSVALSQGVSVFLSHWLSRRP